MNEEVGKYAYLVGVIGAVVIGILMSYIQGSVGAAWLTSLVVLAGLIVGFMNIGTKDIKDFLMISAVLVIVAGIGGAGATLGSVGIIGPFLSGILIQLLAFVVPATVVVALKEILLLAKH